MVLLHSHLCTRRSRHLGLQSRRETDAERISHGADDLDLGFLGLAVVQHGDSAGTDELPAIIDTLPGDDGQGVVDLLEVDLLAVE